MELQADCLAGVWAAAPTASATGWIRRHRGGSPPLQRSATTPCSAVRRLHQPEADAQVVGDAPALAAQVSTAAMTLARPSPTSRKHPMKLVLSSVSRARHRRERPAGDTVLGSYVATGPARR
jgi:hypothetical protein